ncbi:DUF488 family protein [Coprothermobacteraceae bacterium]|nr:DUF488 family protein [Coprothermobacteraceae bacterium]
MIRVKRIYEPVEPDDGIRVLVDRTWPRGVSKENAHVDLWLKSLAPSKEACIQLSSGAIDWPAFVAIHRSRVMTDCEELKRLVELAKSGTVTLLYANRDTQHNSAVLLKQLVEELLAQG